MAVNVGTMVRDNRQIGIQLEAQFSRNLAEAGLTGVQAQILLYILSCGEEGASLTAIHQQSGYSMAAISSLVKRLREKEYVRAEPCAGDDRKKLLFGTEKGIAVQAYLDRSMHEAYQRIYQNFSEEELVTLDRLQKKILGNLALLRADSHKEVSGI